MTAATCRARCNNPDADERPFASAPIATSESENTSNRLPRMFSSVTCALAAPRSPSAPGCCCAPSLATDP
eukprot:4572653-Pyramimonas_sp.AAC.1